MSIRMQREASAFGGGPGFGATGGRRCAVAAVLAAVLLAGAGCNTSSQPNVVILLMDAMRADRLGCYGYSRDTSPVVDSLAAGGVLFRHCYATSDYTPASTASLFTGVYPLAHGYVNADYNLEAPQTTLAEVLDSAGYATAGFTANGLAGAKYGMDQGFGTFFESNRAPADKLIDAMTEFVHGHADEPFFVYAHFMEVHDPYTIPLSARSRFADPAGFAYDMQDTLMHDRFVLAALWSQTLNWRPAGRGAEEVQRYFRDYGFLYDAAIAHWNQRLRGLLRALRDAGVAERTILIVVADHGEQLLEHGFFGHGNSGYDVGLHVPFVYYDPERTRSGAIAAGQRLDTRVSLVDVVPTLLARLGMSPPETIQGVSRLDLMTDGEDENTGSDTIYTEGTFAANRPFTTLIQTYRDGPWKLILDRFRDSKELYDLQRDPEEQENLFAAEPEVVQRLMGPLRDHYHTNLRRFMQQRRSPQSRQAEKIRELQALGYVSGRHTALRELEFLPMAQIRQAPFGPFGDEKHLQRFGSLLDFTRGEVLWGQVVRGYSDVIGRADASGCWFDCRATFMLRAGDGCRRLVFRVNIVPDADGGRPTRLGIEINNRIVASRPVADDGRQEIVWSFPEPPVPGTYMHCGLRTDHRFVLHAGETPRTDLHGSLKILSVALE